MSQHEEDVNLSEDDTDGVENNGIMLTDEQLNDLSVNIYKYSKASVIDAIKLFFSDKHPFYGGDFIEGQLFAEENIDLLLKTTFSDGVTQVYEILLSCEYESQFEFEDNFKDEMLDKDWSPSIKLVLEMMQECHEKRIPKALMGGMLILNVKFCLGMEKPSAENVCFWK